MTPDDQLSLQLDPARPALATPLRPMLPRATAAPFDDPDHLFEPWWGGERAFASLEVGAAAIGEAGAGEAGAGEAGAGEAGAGEAGAGEAGAGEAGAGAGAGAAGTVRIVDRRGRDLAPVLPELAGPGGLGGRLGGHSAVLDGCLVVVDDMGRPDPRALAARLAGRAGPTVVYLAFDIVGIDGRPLLAEPLERRRERLERTVEPGGSVLVVPAILGEGLALHAAATAQGIPAIVGRHRRSPYLPGVRSRLWRLVPAGAPSGPKPGPGLEPDPEEPTRAGAGPILALIQRLPLEGGD
jgi:ATP-dependent DNA ligase